MRKAICLILLVAFAGISIHAQERKMPEPSREKQEGMRRDFNEMRMKREFLERKKKGFHDMEKKKGFHDMGMNKEYHEMALKKREMEFENYISEMEFEKEMRELELEKVRAEFKEGDKNSSCNSGRCGWKGGKCRLGKAVGDIIFCLMFMAMVALIHILLTIWVFLDTRKSDPSGLLWVVLTLLTGFMGAFLYALVRLGDGKKK